MTHDLDDFAGVLAGEQGGGFPCENDKDRLGDFFGMGNDPNAPQQRKKSD